MHPVDEFFLSRTLDHAVISLIGTFIAWLGYKLFRDMPSKQVGESKISLPGGISILLSRVGPGVFFALFGTAMIGYTATRPVSLADSNALTGETIQTNGAFEGSNPTAVVPAPTLPQSALPVDRLVLSLAELAHDNDQVAIGPVQLRHETALREARARLMLESWDAAWGDKKAFAAWVFERAAVGTPPPEAARGAAVYQGAP